MPLGRLIRDWRLVRRYTQADLTERAKIGATLLSRYERGVTSPTVESLDKVIEALGVPGDTDDRRRAAFWLGPFLDGEPALRSENLPGSEMEEVVTIHAFLGVPVNGWNAADTFKSGEILTPAALAPRRGEGCVDVIMDDDSMEPKFTIRKTILLIDTTLTKPRSGDVVAVVVNGAGLIREYRRTRKAETLVAWNPWYPTVPVVNGVEFLGTVLVVRTALKTIRSPK